MDLNRIRCATQLERWVPTTDLPYLAGIYNGSLRSASTVKNLLARLNGVSIEPGTLIWDCGNVSKRYVEMVADMGWKLICIRPKTSKEAK
jgi:hypothetical protein